MVAGVVVIVSTLASDYPAAAAVDDDGCAINAPEREYDVAAINVDMILNQFGDHDPTAMMYVLENRIVDVRAQETSREVSPGLRQDPIQALVLRANVGECVVINFTNRMTDTPASFNIDGLALTATNGPDEVGNDPEDFVGFLETITYRLSIPNDPLTEGAYEFHSLYDTRQTTAHGLFGMLVVEPAGSQYLDPEAPFQPLESGWEAIIVDPAGVDFREFVIMMHDVGDEDSAILDMNDNEIPVVDEIAGSCRPASFALNYRS